MEQVPPVYPPLPSRFHSVSYVCKTVEIGCTEEAARTPPRGYSVDACNMDSVPTLIDTMARCHLLEPSQLEEVQQRILPSHGDPRGLAAALLKRQWLTPFQINRLFAGRGPELLQGSYVLLERIGEGGMGQVFKARNWKLGHIVALKLVRKELLTNPTVVGRFRREIQATAQLDHPNLIRAFDADQTDDGLFIVMEYVEGIDLGRLVKEQGPVLPVQACNYIRQAALGLQHAHERGMVHRDIKPPNLLRANQGEVVKVLDLGLARLQDPAQALHMQSSPGLTQLGIIVGTVDFIAPEQARDSRTVDIRADLYSLGCTFCFLLTGKVPYPGGTPTEKLIKHNVDPLPPLLEIAPAVRAIVHKLMAKNPDVRYQTPAELAEALDLLLAHPEKLRARRLPELLPPTVPTMSLPREIGAPLVPLVPTEATKPRRAAATRPKLAPITSPATSESATAVLEVEPPQAVAVAVAVPVALPEAVPLTAVQNPRKRFRLAWFGVVFAVALVGVLLAWPALFPPAKSQGEPSSQKPVEPVPEPRPKQWDLTVREFLVVGPVPRNSDLVRKILAAPNPGESYDRAFGTPLTWTRRVADKEDALKVQGFGKSTLFAQFQVYSQSPRNVKMISSAADEIDIQLNAKAVLSKNRIRLAPKVEVDRTDVRLLAGWNKVLIRLDARDVQPFECYISFSGEGERPEVKLEAKPVR